MNKKSSTSSTSKVPDLEEPGYGLWEIKAIGEGILSWKNGMIVGNCFLGTEKTSVNEELNRFANAGWDRHDRKAQTLMNTLISKESDQLLPRIRLEGTEFECRVWLELIEIPEGDTRSYGEIAERIGKPKASRAVGRAVGANRIAWIIPCHRVIQKNGQIGGYRWGEMTKRRLLDYELNKDTKNLVKTITPSKRERKKQC